MVYLAAGVSGLTSIVGAFFVKEHLGLSAAFLASLTFWAGIPWILKMPLGHLVDLIWRRKTLLVYIGASLIGLSILIMYGIIAHTVKMAGFMSIEVWFVVATILAPTGYVLQDVVADAMTVEAVPNIDDFGNPYTNNEIKAMHTTMQTLGRVAIIGGLVAVAALNISMFSGVENMSGEMKVAIYADIYLLALIIPLISITGVILGGVFIRKRARKLEEQGLDHSSIDRLLFAPECETSPNWWILGGSLIFSIFTVAMGMSQIPFAQEIIFLGSMSIILFLMYRLLLELEPKTRRMLVGTAVIIFVFRAVPLPGPGATWFEIDVLGFDQHFLSVLSLIASFLTLVGMVILRPIMARHSIAFVVTALTIAAGILSLPNIGLYYGLHEWTTALTGGVVDARFIAIIDTAIESPLGQIAMIPMLAWIAKNAPPHLKATFFAVMASFTNLALSAASLGTKYLNEIFLVTREVRNRVTNAIITTADYGELGWLLIVVTLIGLIVPLLTILLIQRSPLRTNQ
jgi:MFS family permease